MSNPHLPIFAFLTGLHLAGLQFSYFFLLMLNITSTYITYAAIVLSWMAGTLIGLLWQGLGARMLLIAGTLSYYAIYALVISDPLSPTTLPVACLGVAITGLWAGRFFVVMYPLFGRADRLFFHENNGFLVGIIGVFVGFTLLGIKFLLWGPLLTGVILLIYWRWLTRRLGANRRADPVEYGGAAAGLISTIADQAAKNTHRFALLMIIVNLLLPLGILLQALATGDDYWVLFEGERNAITWFSTIQLLVIALVAYLNHQAARLSQRLKLDEAGRNYWIWIVFALGFVFLALDERFVLHQRIRQELLLPANLFVDIPFLRPGDVMLFIYFGIGLVFTLFLLRELSRRSLALYLFFGALALILASAVMDSLLLEITRSWPLPHFWTSAFEEVGEIWSQLLFLLSFLLVLQVRLLALKGVPDLLQNSNR